MRKINYSTAILPADIKKRLLNNPPVSWLNDAPVKLEARKKRCHSERQSSSFDFLLSSLCNRKGGNLNETGRFFLLFFPSLIAILFFYPSDRQTILTVDKAVQWRRHTTTPINRDKKTLCTLSLPLGSLHYSPLPYALFCHIFYDLWSMLTLLISRN